MEGQVLLHALHGSGRSAFICLFPALALVPLLCHASIAAPSGPPAVGFVVEINGDWELAGDRARQLLLGTTLPGGARVRSVNPEEPASRIRIALLDGQSLALSCGSPGACKTDLLLPETLHEPSSVAERLLRAAEHLGAHPKRYVPIASRSFSLREAIVGVEPEGLDLRNAILGESPVDKTLFLRLVRLTENPPSSLVQLKLRGGSTIAVPERSVAPGLYELAAELVQAVDSELPWPDGAWILVALPQHKGELEKDLWKATELLSSGAPPASDSARAFLRAYLALLWKTTEERDMQYEGNESGTP